MMSFAVHNTHSSIFASSMVIHITIFQENAHRELLKNICETKKMNLFGFCGVDFSILEGNYTLSDC